MSEWLYLGLNPSEFAKNSTEGGVSVSLSPSPYDVPEAARIDVDAANKRFSLEFQYIGEEPIKKIADEPGISFRLGRNSNRLYAVDVELNKFNLQVDSAQNLAVRISDTIGELAARHKWPARSQNYKIVQSAVDESLSLFDNLKFLF
jgi:hypothetical protein